MNLKKPSFSQIKAAICILALINLAALFIFNYELPSFLTDKADTDKSSDVSTEKSPAEEAGYAFSFEPESLTYDGSTELDLLSGVTLTGPDGTALDAEIFARISTGSSISEKVIEYSADTDAGQLTASRDLKLVNYNGPAIILPDPLPEIDETMLDSISSAMPSDGTFRAEDGYGNDITSSITFSYTRDETDPTKVHYTFTITNMFNDSATVEAAFTIANPKPVITLTENAVTIKKNSAFSPSSYIASAVDVDGSSILHKVTIEGKVNTWKVGTYTLVYSVTGGDGSSSIPKELVITVE